MSENEVRKVVGYIPISQELLDDINGVPLPASPLSRWQRIRQAIRGWWYNHRPHLTFGPCDCDEYWS